MRLDLREVFFAGLGRRRAVAALWRAAKAEGRGSTAGWEARRYNLDQPWYRLFNHRGTETQRFEATFLSALWLNRLDQA
jgi:hypothetical protein